MITCPLAVFAWQRSRHDLGTGTRLGEALDRNVAAGGLSDGDQLRVTSRLAGPRGCAGECDGYRAGDHPGCHDAPARHVGRQLFGRSFSDSELRALHHLRSKGPYGHEDRMAKWRAGFTTKLRGDGANHPAEARIPRAVAPNRRPCTKADVVIFVHGYNYSFEESLFRLAQLVVDGRLTETPVLFAWPSAASVTGYVSDKDAVTYSRDDLVRVLRDVANDPKVGKITVFGHSMGAWLTVEALRQLRLTGQDAVIGRLNGVVLAAPDIDVDVFRRQMEVIGPLDPPLTLLVSRDDRALKISSRIAGSRDRIGARDVNDPQVQVLAGPTTSG